jgi:hypothetical protein
MRIIRLRLLLAISLTVGGCAPLLAWFHPVPDWAAAAAALPTPRGADNATAVVLLDETAMEVDTQGVATTTHRMAIRMLSASGKAWAEASVYYLKSADRVRSAGAWLIRNGNSVSAPVGVDWTDRSNDSYGTLYSDLRYKYINRSGDAVAGDVFVAETKVTGPMLASDMSYVWRSSWGGLPIIEETFRIKLPPGFSLSPCMKGKNPPALLRTADGLESVWTARDQPFVPAEPDTPQSNLQDPHLFVRIVPPAGAAQFKPVVLRTWNDLAVWLETLNATQCDRSAPLAETSRRLTAGCTTSLEKIQALGGYVGRLRYVALDEELSKGLGYQPHKASQVFEQSYGDCKDKANLLCAMLRENGIEAYIAVARSGDDLPVWPEFPSATQFDHAIVAIRVDDSIDLASVVTTSKWGRLLFFDPTAEHTVVGDLPWYLQGTSVFVQDRASDALIELPRIAPLEGHAYVRKVTLHLKPDGSCTGEASILGRGQAGAALRNALFQASTDEALRKLVVNLLGSSVRNAQLQQVERHDEAKTGVCGVSFEFSKSNYLQFFNNGLAVAKGEILSRGDVPALTAAERRLPVKLRPLAFEDHIEVMLADGMRLEELPAPLSFSSVYGSYHRDFKVDGKAIIMDRQLELEPQSVPAADYEPLRKFLSALGKADRASVLLHMGS